MQKVATAAQAAEVRTAKLVAEEETGEMRLGIVLEKTAMMAPGAASKFSVFQVPRRSLTVP